MVRALEAGDIQAANEKLKAVSNPVRIRRNGNYLVLRAVVPKKSGEGAGVKQRDLSLGIAATRAGLKRAVVAAKALEVELNERAFDWGKYDRRQPPEPEIETVAQMIERFKPFKMRRGKRTCSEDTWEKHWLAVYKQLPQDEPLNPLSIAAVLQASGENSRSREQRIEKLQALCRFAELAFDFDLYVGNYEPEPRDIPPDSLILQWRELIPNPAWRWAYGIMATFGARPHEVFFCEMIEPDVLQIHKGKTGPRISAAIRPEWVDLWGLQDKPELPIKLPVEREDFKACGATVGQQYRRYGVPFEPYDLRHAWAIRASVVEKLPVSTAADFMGHSAALHTKTYHRWLSRETNLAVYRKIVQGIV